MGQVLELPPDFPRNGSLALLMERTGKTLDELVAPELAEEYRDQDLTRVGWGIAAVDMSPLTPDEIKRGQELAVRFGLVLTVWAAGKNESGGGIMSETLDATDPRFWAPGFISRLAEQWNREEQERAGGAMNTKINESVVLECINDAVALFGDKGDGLFNSANFSVAVKNRFGGQLMDGRVVAMILSRPGVERVGDAYWRRELAQAAAGES